MSRPMRFSRFSGRCLAGPAAAVVVLASLGSAAASSSISSFDAPDGVNGTYAAGINAGGSITGFYRDANDLLRGFIRSPDGTVTEFDVPGATGGEAPRGINGNGTVVGDYANDSGDHSFLRTIDGTISTYDVVPGETGSCCINGAGVTAGVFLSNEPGGGPPRCRGSIYHGYERFPDGSVTTIDIDGAIQGGTVLQGLSSKGWTTGHFLTCGVTKRHYTFTGFIRALDGTVTPFSAADDTDQTLPCCINGKGWTAGYYNKQVTSRRYRQVGFVRSPDGTVTSFDASGDTGNTAPTAINAAGQIVGSTNKKSAAYRGFLRASDGTITLFDVPGSTGGVYPADINANGIVTGTYYDQAGIPHGFVGTP